MHLFIIFHLTIEDELANGIELKIMWLRHGTISRSLSGDVKYAVKDIRQDVGKSLETRTDSAKHHFFKVGN